MMSFVADFLVLKNYINRMLSSNIQLLAKHNLHILTDISILHLTKVFSSHTHINLKHNEPTEHSASSASL